MGNILENQKQIRIQSEKNFNERKKIINPKVGKIYWFLPSIGEDGWVHGKEGKFVKMQGSQFVLQHLEILTQFVTDSIVLSNGR